MTQQNAEKKLAQLGSVDKTAGVLNCKLTVNVGTYTLTCRCQDGLVSSIHTKRQSEEWDAREDYYPGSYWKSINQAIRFGLQ